MKPKRINIFSSQFLFNSSIVFLSFVILDMIALNVDISLGLFVFVPWILLFINGIGLIITTYREKISGKQKTFLLITGFSSSGFLLGVILHNLLYALGTITKHLVILNKIISFLEGAFFLVAVIICPVGLIVGIVGTLIIKKKSRSKNT